VASKYASGLDQPQQSGRLAQAMADSLEHIRCSRNRKRRSQLDRLSASRNGRTIYYPAQYSNATIMIAENIQ
jgi:hypothetical protein